MKVLVSDNLGDVGIRVFEDERIGMTVRIDKPGGQRPAAAIDDVFSAAAGELPDLRNQTNKVYSA